MALNQTYIEKKKDTEKGNNIKSVLSYVLTFVYNKDN